MKAPVIQQRQILLNLFHQGGIQAGNMLLQLLLIPLVISRAGLELNGLFLMSASIASLLSMLINFGGNQTIPQEQHHTGFIRLEIGVRAVIFIVFTLLILTAAQLPFSISPYLVGIIPILLAEVINPYAFLLSQNRLRSFNLVNLLMRILALLLVWQLMHQPKDTPWVNAWVGLSLIPGYAYLLFDYCKKAEKRSTPFSVSGMMLRIRQNAPLVGGNLVVNLQQSFLLYVLGAMGKPVVLGLYALADKLVWSARTLLIAFSNAIYPVAIRVAKEGELSWKKFRSDTHRILTYIMIPSGLLLMLLAPWLGTLMAEKGDPLMITVYIRWIAFVPLIMSLNVLNVLELLIRREFRVQLRINLHLLIFSVLISSFFLINVFYAPQTNSWVNLFMPAYLLLMECITLWQYEKHRHRTG
jgi:O-antigen/teichoic acid export membrane protein